MYIKKYKLVDKMSIWYNLFLGHIFISKFFIKYQLYSYQKRYRLHTIYLCNLYLYILKISIKIIIKNQGHGQIQSLIVIIKIKTCKIFNTLHSIYKGMPVYKKSFCGSGYITVFLQVKPYSLYIITVRLSVFIK